MGRYITKRCLICKDEEKLSELYPRNFKDEDLTPAVFSARRVTEHWHYRMVRCENCGLVFSAETLADSELFDLYSASQVTFSEHQDTIRKDYWKPLAKYRDRLKNQAALEVGCSSGFFLDQLMDEGIDDVWGFEPSTQAKDIASDRVKPKIQNRFFEGKKSLPGQDFGLVCCFQTLDHLSDPLGFLENCREVLKPGGLVYLVTHNVDALQAKVLGEKSPIVDVEHIYLFNKTTLPRILDDSGFNVLETRSLQNSYPLRYWATMLPMPKGVKNATLSALKGFGLSEFSPSVSAGNMYAIAERRP